MAERADELAPSIHHLVQPHRGHLVHFARPIRRRRWAGEPARATGFRVSPPSSGAGRLSRRRTQAGLLPLRRGNRPALQVGGRDGGVEDRRRMEEQDEDEKRDRRAGPQDGSLPVTQDHRPGALLQNREPITGIPEWQSPAESRELPGAGEFLPLPLKRRGSLVPYPEGNPVQEGNAGSGLIARGCRRGPRGACRPARKRG